MGSDKNVLNKKKRTHISFPFETIQSTPLRVNQITSVIGDELLVYRLSPVTIVNGAVSRIVSFYTHNSSQGVFLSSRKSTFCVITFSQTVSLFNYYLAYSANVNAFPFGEWVSFGAFPVV